jgi:hypothetical protein
VDHYLQPIVKSLPNVIKDTTDFLKRLQDLSDIPEGAILCTMDVVGLYPHIPHLEDLSSMRKSIEDFRKNCGMDKVLSSCTCEEGNPLWSGAKIKTDL